MADVRNPVLHLLFLCESVVLEHIGYESAHLDLLLAPKTALGLTQKLAKNVLRGYRKWMGTARLPMEASYLLPVVNF